MCTYAREGFNSCNFLKIFFPVFTGVSEVFSAFLQIFSCRFQKYSYLCLVGGRETHSTHTAHVLLHNPHLINII